MKFTTTCGVFTLGLLFCAAINCNSQSRDENEDDDGSKAGAGGRSQGEQGGGGPSGGGTAGKGGGNAATGGAAGSGKGGVGGTAGAQGGAGAVSAAAHFAYVGGDRSDVIGYKFDPLTGTLTSIGKTAAGTSVSYLAYHPNGKNLYVLDGAGDGTVRAFSIDAATGKLTPQNSQPVGGGAAVHLSVHPRGGWLFAATYSGGNARAFKLAADGSLGAGLSLVRPGLQPHQIVASPSGNAVFVPCKEENRIAQYLFNEKDGALSENSPATVMSNWPRHMAFHPTEKYAYVLKENPADVVSYLYDAAAGKLTAPEELKLGPDEDSGSHIEVTPNGKYVYAGGRGENRIYVFEVNAQTGRLTAKGSSNAGGDIATPRDFNIDPTGQFVIVGNQGRGTVSVLKIGADGSLTKVGAPVDAVPGAQAVVVVPVPRTASP